MQAWPRRYRFFYLGIYCACIWALYVSGLNRIIASERPVAIQQLYQGILAFVLWYITCPAIKGTLVAIGSSSLIITLFGLASHVALSAWMLHIANTRPTTWDRWPMSFFDPECYEDLRTSKNDRLPETGFKIVHTASGAHIAHRPAGDESGY